MFDSFFVTHIPVNHYAGTYDLRLVFLSYLVATAASYIALDLTGHLRDGNNTKTSLYLWLFGGSFAMGAGIWSMHFIGMLAFKLQVPMTYDPIWTLVSLLVAIIASGFALLLLKSRVINIKTFAIGGAILGLAIASMHYIGMHAMTDTMKISYRPNIFFLSILIAIIASEAALWLAIKSNQGLITSRIRLKIISAFVMGFAICGMHYTGMAAAIFSNNLCLFNPDQGLEPQLLSIIIAVVIFVILGITLSFSYYKEILNHRLVASARLAGLAEVAINVLHNVGNALNSVNVSANIIAENISQSKLNGLEKLHDLLQQHQHHLPEFLAEPGKSEQVINYMQLISECWQQEQRKQMDEISTLIQSIDHIKNIIATQQKHSKYTAVKEMTSIANLLDEALQVSAINFKGSDIIIEKKYEAINEVQIDKAKLLQILINLILNAVDAVNATTMDSKKIILHCGMYDAKQFYIEVIDNGIGIDASLLIKIFHHGFTTKQSGHGFGLHISALAAREMGGSLLAKSDGLNKGATMLLTLPIV